MTRAAIYARYSTDNQNPLSIADQVALCRDYAGREGFSIVAVYADPEKSAASMFNRSGVLELMRQARAKAFDVVVVEHTDRLSRSMRDMADIHERLTFFGIELRAVHSGGLMTTATVGLFGLVGQMQREDGAKKVHRGMAGVVRRGGSAGGRAYGYRPVPGRPGELVIDSAEAAIVRRILEQYAAGRSPRAIAHDLNREGITAPRGTRWNASTLNGHAGRGTGILRNRLYVGEIVWNKVRMLKDPDTGRRVSRVNAAANRQVVAAPHLAIVPAGIFAAVEARKAASVEAPRPEAHRRPRHLLSGLLRCGACGAGMAKWGQDKTGRSRVRCTAATESGTCPDPKTFYLDTIERAVLGGLTAELREPRRIAEYVREYHAERKRLAATAATRRARLERRLAEIEREAERLVDAIAKGEGDPRMLLPRTKELGAERDQIEGELQGIAKPQVIALHPAVLKRYEAQLNALSEALRKGPTIGVSEAAEALRELVAGVTVHPDSSRRGGVMVEIAGRLNALLGLESYPHGVAGLAHSVVAEARLRRNSYRSPSSSDHVVTLRAVA